MSVYRSSVASQLRAFERHVERFIRQSFYQGGNRIRHRMIAEQLSKPKEAPNHMFGVRRKTGNLQRSLWSGVEATGTGLTLKTYIGYRRAPYAEEHENRGRIAFRRLAAEEFRQILDGINTGLQFFAQDFGRAPVPVSIPQEAPVSYAVQEIGRHILLRRAIRRERRAANWRSIVKGS